MFTRFLSVAVVACAVLMLAPAAPAANLYTENFVGNVPLGATVDGTTVGWLGGNWSNYNGDSRVANLPAGAWVAGGAGAATPDGDFWYTARGPGDSGRMAVTTKVGEYTISAANRIDTQFTVDWASSTTKGARFIALVGGKWYGTGKFGTGSDHGAQTNRNVTSWATKSINVESDTWYEWTSTWEEAGLSSTPLTGVPAGNITQFGMWWGNTNNGDAWAIDNFRVTATAASDTYVWDGGTGNWGDAKWTYGGSSGQTPATGFHMFIDAVGGSTVAVAADFSSALTVNVGQTNAAALTVNSGKTLGATQKVNVGASGTLQVDGTLTSPAVISNGTVAISNTGTVNASSLLQIAAGSLTSSSTGVLNVGAGTLMLAGGTGATLNGPLNIAGGTIALNSGTLTYNNATPAAPAVLVFNGGALAGTGSVVPTARYEVYNQTMGMNLTGATASLLAASGTVTLTGANTYGGNTEIKAYTGRTILRVADVAYLDTNAGGGYLYFMCPSFFQNAATNRPATLETKGTLTRTIGTGAKGISFTGVTGDGNPAACFVAVGGPLVIDLNGGTGATLAWDGAAGLNGTDLMFNNSTNADNVVTVKNGLNMGTANRTIRVDDNTASAADYAVIAGAITNDATARNLTKSGTGTLVVSSVGSNFGGLTVSAGTLRLDNSIAASPSMTVTGTTLSANSTLLDINNATLTTAGINIQKGQVIVRGTSVINNTGGARITGSADSCSHSYYFKDDATINGGTGNLETSYTQAAQSYYIVFQDRAQGTFANVRFGPNAEYADNSGHNTVLEVRDAAQLTTPGNMYVMERINDQNRTQIPRVHMQVYQHGGTVTVGGNLRLCDNDPVKGAAAQVHQVDGAYNLWSGSSLKVGGIITGGATRTGVGQSYFNFHGGTLTYTGAGPQTDWLNLTASAVTDGIDSTKNLRLWEGGTIDTGSQNVTINQAILAPSGSGVSAISTTGLTGTVYTNGCPPWVYIARGTGDTTGSGASAVATINASGNITGFIITNPGNNYTATPLINLIRGDTGATGTAVPAGNITLSANSSYNGGLTKQGLGTLTLTAANTYIGPTVIQTGRLALSGAGALASSVIDVRSGAQFDVSGLSGYTLGNGQKLMGNGNVLGAVATAPASLVSPGASIGTLTFSQSLALGGTLQVEVDPAGTGQVDLLNVTGLLNINNGTVDFDPLTTPLDDPAYIFATYGSLDGAEFLLVTDLPLGYRVDYHYLQQNQIALVQEVDIPEPATMALLGLALAGLGGYIRRRVKKLGILSAVLFVAFLVGSAQAAPVTVLNGSFEETTGWNVGGTMYYKGVEYFDVLVDNVLNGSLATPPNVGNCGQPTGPTDPRYWDCTGTNTTDGVAYDARWGDWWSSWTCGPTDGLQSIILDNRTTWTDPTQNWMRQQIGTVGSLKALGSQLAMKFDARYDGSGVDADGDDYFETYFEVGGVKDTASTWQTLFDSTNKVPNWAGLGNPQSGYGTAVKGNPGQPKPGSVGPQNMKTFTATVDLTQYVDPSAAVNIVFHNYRVRDDGAASLSNRVYLDNVRVDVIQPVDIPEPATLALLGLALAGLGGYVRRRRNAA